MNNRQSPDDHLCEADAGQPSRAGRAAGGPHRETVVSAAHASDMNGRAQVSAPGCPVVPRTTGSGGRAVLPGPARAAGPWGWAWVRRGPDRHR